VRLPRYGQPVPALVTSLSDSTESVTSLSTADFNLDGFADVLVTRTDYPTYNTFPLQILLSNRRGGFYDGTSRIFEGPSPSVQVPREVVIADFDNDGRPDIFIADTGYDHSPGPGFHNTLVLSTPDGRLRDATGNLPPQIRFTHSATAADVNGDGSLDLYIGSIYTESHDEPPEILLNDGTGRFSACGNCLPGLLSAPVVISGQPLHGPTYTGSQFVDVNNDGAPDLVLAGNGYYRVPSGIVTSDSQVLLNDGSGHFSVLSGALPARPWNNSAVGVDVRAADLNHDRHPDLLISYTPQDPFYVGRWIQVLINNGGGTFRDETTTRLPQADNKLTWLTTLDVADLNGDGNPDIITHPAYFFRSLPPLYLNKGNGDFRPLPLAYTQTGGDLFTEVDARGNGHRDFFTCEDGLTTFPNVPCYIVHQAGKPEPPGPPTQIRAERDPATGKLTITWPYDWGASRYELWRSSTAGKLGSRIGQTRLTRYVDNTALAGQSYYYSVRALNSAGKSAFAAAANNTADNNRQPRSTLKTKHSSRLNGP
jgi:FG-GAP-like repeat